MAPQSVGTGIRLIWDERNRRLWNGEEEDVVRGQLLGVKPDIKLNRERVPQW